MLEKRYFYSDPLAAEWMARHFGMKHMWKEFTVRPGPYRYQDCALQDSTVKFYIHPDSLHMLELKDERDVWVLGDRIQWHIHPDLHKQEEWPDGLKLIQRNGTPFMWPEVEDVR